VTDLIPLVIGVTSFVVAVVWSLSNRVIRQERIEHLEGLVTDLRGEMNDNERRCADQVTLLKQRCAHLEGQIEAVTGELGEKIGSRVAAAVVNRLTEERGL
jgi:hypothetical protein